MNGRREDMAAFDLLPLPIRRALAGADNAFPAVIAALPLMRGASERRVVERIAVADRRISQMQRRARA